MENYDIIIIGAGPAGLTAGIYSCRNRLKTLILSMDVGGQAAVAGEIGSWPGEKKIAGIDLVNRFKEHYLSYPEAKLEISKEITSMVKTEDGLAIKTKVGEEYQARAVIVASGKCPKKLDIPGAKELENKGVAYCATCDGPLYKDKTVAVVGGGNSALRACEILARTAAKIYLVTLTEKPAGEKIMVENIEKNSKIEVVGNAQTTEILGSEKVDGLKYKNRKTGEGKDLKVDGVFVMIGSISSSNFLSSLALTNEHNEIKVNKDCSTKTEGLFAAGDITDSYGEQIVIAAGEGAKAAMAAEQYLSDSLRPEQRAKRGVEGSPKYQGFFPPRPRGQNDNLYKLSTNIPREEVKKMEDPMKPTPAGPSSAGGGATPPGGTPTPPAGQSPLGDDSPVPPFGGPADDTPTGGSPTGPIPDPDIPAPAGQTPSGDSVGPSPLGGATPPSGAPTPPAGPSSAGGGATSTTPDPASPPSVGGLPGEGSNPSDDLTPPSAGPPPPPAGSQQV